MGEQQRVDLGWSVPPGGYRGGEGPPLGPPPKTPSGYYRPPEPPPAKPAKKRKKRAA